MGLEGLGQGLLTLTQQAKGGCEAREPQRQATDSCAPGARPWPATIAQEPASSSPLLANAACGSAQCRKGQRQLGGPLRGLALALSRLALPVASIALWELRKLAARAPRVQ